MILLLRVAQQEGWAAQSALVPILIRPDRSENLFQDHLKPFLLLFLGQENIKYQHDHGSFDLSQNSKEMLFRPPVLKVKAKIYFASPKIQIYVFLLPASEKGLRKEEHGLTTKCLKTNKQIKSVISSSADIFWVNE